MLTVRAWVKRIDQAASAVGWNNKITAGQAVMAIPTGTPAFNWLEENSDSQNPVTDWKVLKEEIIKEFAPPISCLLYTSPSPRDKRQSRMPSSA